MRILAFLLTALIAAAQTPRMSQPVLGYLFDAGSQSVRAVSGVPGAASADPAMALDDAFSLAFVRSNGGLAVGVGKSGRVLAARWQEGAAAVETPLDTAFGAPERVAFARGADRALLASPQGVELISGLAGTPESMWAYAAQALGGAPVGVDLSGDGAVAAVTLDSGQIVEASADGVRPVATGSAARYVAGGRDLLVYSKGGLSLVTEDGVTAVADGIGDGAELAGASPDRAVLYNSRTGVVTLVDLADGRRSDISGYSPARAQALSISGLFYFEDAERGGLLLDANASPPRVSVVPGVDVRRAQ